MYSAEEVRQYVPSPLALEKNWVPRKSKVNLSNIREKYRDARIHERYALLTREKIKIDWIFFFF